MADDAKSLLLDSLKTTSQLVATMIAGGAVGGAYLMQRAVGVFGGTIDSTAGQRQDGLFTLDFWFATLTLFGPLVMMAICRAALALTVDRARTYANYVTAGGVRDLPPWTVSITRTHPLRLTLRAALSLPLAGLIMHLCVALGGLYQTKLSLALDDRSGVTHSHPILLTLFFAGSTISTVLALIAAFKLARAGSEFEMPRGDLPRPATAPDVAAAA